MKLLMIFLGLNLPIMTLNAATSGLYVIEDGYYSVNAEFSSDGLLVIEPNKNSLYKRTEDKEEYVFVNPTNHIKYGIRVIDDATIEAFKPDHPDINSTILKLKTASAVVSPAVDNEMDKIARKYQNLSETDNINTQTWTFCALVAMGYATLSQAEAEKWQFNLLHY